MRKQGIDGTGMLNLYDRVTGIFNEIFDARLLTVALFALEPAFVFILVPAGLLVVGITAALRKVLKRMHKRVQEANSAAWSFFQERLESMMIIRVFSMEDKTCQQAEQKMNACKAARLTRCHFSNFCNFGFQAIADGGYLLAAFYCGYGILRGSISYGTFTAILQLVGQVQSPFASITGVVP